MLTYEAGKRIDASGTTYVLRTIKIKILRKIVRKIRIDIIQIHIQDTHSVN